MAEPRVLLYDLENSPSLGWTWDKWNTNVIEFQQDWFLLSFAYRWLGDRKPIKTVALPDFKGYDRDRTNDRQLVKALWSLFDEADVVVAHNGNRFDQRKARARFLVHGFDPPTPFREVDTLKMARRHFSFTSNSLDDLCRQLGIGRKVANQGFKTWQGCMAGDPKAWALMRKYNRQDVQMLEDLYLKLLPWDDRHPNMALIGDKPDACPKCGAVSKLRSKGWRYYGVTKRRAFRCQACTGIVYGRSLERSDVSLVG